MANPSLKNGYLSIATELVEQFALRAIPSSEMRILWVVWRKTWGWTEGDRKKDWDWISLSQFEKGTGMKHANVASALKSLVVKRILLKGSQGYKFNQNYDAWVVVKRIPPVVKRIRGSSQTTTKSSSQTHTNNRYKDTNTKDTIAADAARPFSFEEELEKLRGGTRLDYKIIALYWKKKKWVFENHEQFNAALRRELRAAGALKGYDGKQIGKAIEFCQEKYPEIWTLETVGKRITDLINTKL